MGGIDIGHAHVNGNIRSRVKFGLENELIDRVLWKGRSKLRRIEPMSGKLAPHAGASAGIGAARAPVRWLRISSFAADIESWGPLDESTGVAQCGRGTGAPPG
jgi:hypothetical protein